MRVLFLIADSEAPVLEGPSFSRGFKDFVSLCLQKDPEKRLSAKELLKNKWIKGAKKSTTLLPLIAEFKDWRARQNDLADDELPSISTDGTLRYIYQH